MKPLQFIRRLFFLITIFFFVSNHYSQIYTLNGASNNTTVSTCSGTFYDSGGDFFGYNINEFYTITFCSNTPGTEIVFDFTSFDVETNWDALTVYNGPNIFSPQINGSPFDSGNPPGTISSDGTGCLTFTFSSDGSVALNGWEAVISCNTPSCNDGIQNQGETGIDCGGPCPNVCTDYLISQGGTITGCGGTLYDSGGQNGNYSNGENSTMTFCSSSGGIIALDFSAFPFQVETNFDFLNIYDGTNTTGTPMYQSSVTGGTTNPGIIASTGSCITVEFISDGSVNFSGWGAVINCPTCTDGIQNGNETGVDCGGPTCTPCPSCYDGIQNQNETGIDCGGICPTPCHCSNGIQDNGETGIDCGGPCPLSCPVPCDITATYNIIGGASQGGCCTYNLELSDLTGDGWGSGTAGNNDGTINVVINGVTFGPYWVATGSSFLNIPLNICDGESIELIYNQGNPFFGFEGDNSYELFDSQGNSIFSSGLAPSNGSSFNGNAACFGGFSCTGGTVELIAQGQGEYSFVINNDFDAGGAGNGWNASPAATFTNPCDPSVDGGTYMWMGDNTSAPRTLETLPVDVSCGGEICFFIDFATQGNASPCEGPDLTDEGVYLQYSVDGGFTWIVIDYFDPTLGIYNAWSNFCYQIPQGAVSNGTIFQWSQTSASSNINDHWGIDNVTITSLANCDPYIYDWDHVAGSPDDSTDIVTITQTTTYTVTYGNGVDVCTTDVTVVVPDGPVITATTLADETCPGDCNGAASSVVTNGTGTPPYSYLWDNSAASTTTSINNLCAGDYVVTVTDDNNCTYNDTVTINSGVILNPVIDPVAAQCLNSNSFTFSSNNSSSSSGIITSYLWDFGDGSGTSSQANPSYSYNTAGTFTVTLTISDGNCTVNTTLDVNVWANPTTSTSITDETCNGDCDGSIDLTVLGSGGYTYSWDNGIGNIEDPTNLCANTYNLLLIDINGCQTSTSATVGSPAALGGSITAQTNVLCNADATGAVTVAGANGTAGYTYSLDGGTTTQISGTFNNLTAGAITVTVVDANGCTFDVPVTITEPNVLTSSLVSTTDATCGLANGDFEVTGLNGTAPYQYSNDNGVTFQPSGTFNGLTAGSYNILIQDDNGCQTTITVNVADLSGLTAVIDSQSDADCFGNSTGIVSVTGSGSTAPYTYDIGNGPQPTGSFNGLAAGSYTVTVTDDNGCIFPVAVTVNEPAALTATATGTNPLCNGSADGSADVTITGGVGTYTTVWQHGPTAEDLIGVLGVGTYTLDITDDNNCPFTVNVTLTEPTAISSSISGTDVSCNGGTDGTATVTATGGTGTLTYNWSPTPGTGQGTNSVTGLGTTTYTVTITDDNGCFITESFTPAEPTTITLTPNSVNSNCGQADGEVSVSATGGTAGYTYLWDDSNNSTTPNVTGLAAGIYTVIVTDNNNCTETISATITDAGGGSINYSQSNVLCSGGNNGNIDATIIGGTSPFTYAWTGPNGYSASSEDITGLLAGSYDLTVTDDVGCIITLSVTITEPTALSLTTSGINVTCFGGSDGEVSTVATGGTSNYTFEWFDNVALTSSIGNGANLSGLSAGTYYVQVADANGCTFDNNVTITDPNEIIVTTSAIDANCGQADGVISVTSSIGGSGVYVSEVWTDALGNTITNTTAVVSGSYTVTVTDDLGCIGTGVANVSDLSGPFAAVDAFTDVLCNGACDGTASLEVVGGTPNYNYVWTPSPGNGQGTAFATGLCAGIYNVDVIDLNGCATSVSVTISEPSAINLTQITAVDASGASICDGSASVSTAGGTQPYTYSWFDDCALTSANSSINGAFANGLCAGNYGVVVQDDNNCPDTLCITITEPNVIIVTVNGNNTLCNSSCDGNTTATVQGGVAPYNYEWFSSPSGTTINQNSITASNLCAGDYYAIVTDANNVSATSGIYTITEPSVVNATVNVISNYNGQNISCNGACDGAAEVIPSGATPPYTYLWDASANSQTTAIATNLCAGTYSVDVTDANGCTFTFSVTLTEPTVLVNSNTFTDVTCNGFCDGTATASPSGGVAPYAYLWNNAALSTTAAIANLCPGNFDVIITDDNGCSITETVAISEPNPLVVNTSSNGSNCNQNDGDATISIVSGTPSYSYLWDAAAGAQTTATANNLSSGCYDVIITEGNGCSDTVNVCVIDLGAPSVSILSQTDVTCFNGCDGFAQIQVFGGAPPVQYSWYDQNNQPINQTTASAFNLCAGTYTGEMVDANGCQASINVVINQPTAINGIISSSADVTCFSDCDGEATVTASGGTAPYNYQWNDPNLQVGLSANNLCPGNYNVTIIDDNNCNLDVPATIGEPLQLVLSSSTIDAFCNTPTGSASVSITNGGINPFSYLWTPSSQSSDTATNLTPGTYNVLVTDANGCSANNSVTIGNIPAGTATISNVSSTLCNGSCDGTATVSMNGTGNPPYTYDWFTSNGVSIGQDSITAINLCAGFYYCTVTDINGCISTTLQFDITEPAPLVISVVSDSTSCFNDCNGSSTVTASGGTASYFYQWDDPLLQNTAVADNLCAGLYNVIVSDNNGCIDSAQTTILEPNPILLDSTVTNANCQQANGQGCVLATGGTGAYNYLWPDGSINSCNAGLVAGSYIVQVNDSKLCSEDIVVEISDNDGPIASIINVDSVNCFGGNDGSATVDMTGGNGTFFTVQWDANAANQTSPTASNLLAGTYTVTITDDLGCSASTSATIEEPNEIQYIKNKINPTCFGYCDGQMWVNVIGGTAPYSFDWRDNLNNSLGVNNDSISGICAGTYNLIITDANGCVEIVNYVIGEPSQVTAAVTNSAASCFNICDATATANGITGIAPFNYIWDTNASSQTTQTATALCAGTYIVTVTDADGCFNTAQTTITEPTLLNSSISSFGNVSCNGSCDGFAQVDANGGTLAYTYLWSNNLGTNQSANGLCAGNYTVTVTDNNNCSSISNITITEPNPIAVVSTTVDLNCFGLCEGQANVSVSGGTAPYNYQWNDPNFTNTASVINLCAGTYSCTITDSYNCTFIETITIGEPTQLSMSVSSTDANCGLSNGQICISPIGGTAPFTYQWNDPNNQTSACALNLPSNCYTGEILDANGCLIDSLICINDISGPTVSTISTSDITCFGDQDGFIEVTVSGGSGNSTIEWFDNLGNIINSGTGQTSLSTLNPGCYSIQATDNAGCVSSVSECINEPLALTASIFNSNDVSCFQLCDGDAMVNVSGGTISTDYNYVWNDPNSQTTPMAIDLCAGNYLVTISDDNNCSTQTNVTINEPTAINLTLVSSNDVLCYNQCNGSAEVTTSGGSQPFSYAWNNNVFSSINSGLCDGNYSVTVTDANNCSDSLIVNIIQPDSIELSTTTINSTCGNCNGEATVQAIGGNGGFNYNWFGIGTTPTSNNNSGLCPGNFQVEVTDNNGCTNLISNTILDEGTPVIDNISFNSPTCHGLNNGSAFVSISGGVGPYNYLWDDPAQQQVDTAVALSSGLYCVSVTDFNGCVTTSCINVTEPTPLNAVPDLSSTICYGDSTQIWASGQGGTSPYTINWTTPNISGFGPITVNPLATTDYCFTVTDDNGCLSPGACVTITVTPPLALNVTPSMNICSGGSIDVSAIASGGNGNYNLTWVDENNFYVPSTQSADTSFINVGPTVPTWYIVTLSDGCSLNVIDSTQIGLNPNPQALIIATDSVDCAPLNTQFIINSDIGDYFDFDIECDGVNDYSGTNNAYNYTFNNGGIYDICVTVTNSSTGCFTDLTVSNMIEVYDNPDAYFTPSPYQTTILNPSIEFMDGSNGGFNYNWDFGDNSSVSGTINDILNDSINSGLMSDPTHIYGDTGVYTITLVVTDNNGCTDSHQETIIIDGDYILFTPSAFTPNGDGKNDVFYPVGVGINRDNYEFFVFNRWGELIFESYNPAIGWDGTYKGELVNIDAYVYLIRTWDNDNQPHEYMGHVTVVR